MKFRSALFAVLPLTTLACSAAAPSEDHEEVKSPEVWSTQDNPAIFGGTLERKLASLPDVGEAAVIPWAGNYWPTYQDNINHKWDGPSSNSAAKKYELAFGGTGVEDAVSKYHGIESSGSKDCKVDTECNKQLGEVCAKREGKDSGRCIATWFGICHAWSPASILLPEPKNPVTRNGVTFKVQDIKALASLVHNRTTSKFVSLRCDRQGDSEVTFDENGRPVDAHSDCRDTNAGTYHLLLTNYLGIQKKAFVEDRTYDFEVWNQPMRGYKVTSKRSVTAQEANALLGVTTGGTKVTKEGTVAKDAWSHQGSFDVAPGTNYKVTMTGTGDADVYVRFGSQPTTSSYACRPYTESTNEECSGAVPAGATKLFVSVNGYADTSNFKLVISTGGSAPATYVYNANAKSFAYIKADVQYITEASASTDGPLASRIDQYTRTDHYEYILEMNANGEIEGGEWVGASKRNHPDFVWLPTGVSGTSVAGGKITYAQVKSLVDESVGGTTPPQPGNVKTVTDAGTITQNQWKQLGPFKSLEGAFSAAMTGTGDADLYVKKGSAPSATSYDCRPYKDGTAESCDLTGPGDFYVGVNGYAASSDYSLTIKYNAAP